jgi:SAM-dependent methyltransferase
MAPRAFAEIADTFSEIAPFYDRIMEHVNYDRWFMIATELAEMLPRPFRHIDIACGTGTLVKRLRRAGWSSVGADLSPSMLHTGTHAGPAFPAVAADMRALPFQNCLNYATCLFDSINFLLEDQGLCRAFEQIAGTLVDGGLLYFDAVTERMVTQHFEGQEWIENNGRFTTRWSSQYCRKTGIVETRIRVNRGPLGIVRERMYTESQLADAVENAGLTLLAAYDAHNWKHVTQKTVRVDYIAAKNPSPEFLHEFESFPDHIQRMLT